MAKLSIELLQSEQRTWTEMPQSIKHSGGKVVPFGKHMNDKYHLNDPVLEKAQQQSMAFLILLKDHVKEFK